MAAALTELKDFLEVPPLQAAGSAALLGIVLHWSIFRNIEVETYLYEFLALYLAAVLGLGYSYASWTDFSIIQSATRVLLLASSFNAGLVLSIGVYRLFFHRLRRFPGPFAAKLSRFYAMAKAAEKVQYHVEVAKMHDKYGDFVRTGRGRHTYYTDTFLTACVSCKPS
ncbi:hypothetical protein VTN96DRAFT_4826 [Rasamsonia emersonii]